jgi:hypothetical protein
MRILPLALALLTFTGCSRVDRRTFAPTPEAKAAPPKAPTVPLDPRAPLVVIDYTTAAPNYAQLLADAVHAAESRYAGVQYDVIAVVGDIADSDTGLQRATAVMREIIRNRVPPDRVHLGVRTDPDLKTGQVRVYVR